MIEHMEEEDIRNSKQSSGISRIWYPSFLSEARGGLLFRDLFILALGHLCQVNWFYASN